MDIFYLEFLFGYYDFFLCKNINDWKAFELACIEVYGEDNDWLRYAKKGILCHNASLYNDVRLPLERLMRSDKAPIIIATSTLGQGVNLGVSTVIYSTFYQGGNPILPRDFWNIAGRAGRAFVDNEGKILVALDINKKKWQIKKDKKYIATYFDKNKIDVTKSGILLLINYIKKIASKNGVSFQQLIELISENKLEDIGEVSENINKQLDWLDDTLLSLHNIHNELEDGIDYGWVESYFKKSLSYIQALREATISGEEIIAFLGARIKGVVKKVGEDRNVWKSIITSGMPLSSDLLIEKKIPDLIELIGIYEQSEKLIENKIELLKSIEEVLDGIRVLSDEGDSIKSEDIDIIRDNWITGVPLSEIAKHKNGMEIILKLYTYNLPWILNGIGKKLKNLGLNNEAEIIEELSVLLEVGLPTLKMVKIYRAGIRSRLAAKEIGSLFDDESWDKSVKEYRQDLILHREQYKTHLSLISLQWIDLLSVFHEEKRLIKNLVSEFTITDIHNHTDTLIPQKINGEQYLISPDLKVVEKITKSNIDFSSVSEVSGIFYKYDSEKKVWRIVNDNPYIKIV